MITRRQLILWFSDTRKAQPNEWVGVPKIGHTEICCDCGLAHNAWIVDGLDKWLLLKTRDNATTREVRRRNRMIDSWHLD